MGIDDRSFSQAISDRFWAKVDGTGGPDSCWMWTASKNYAGYGKFKDDLGSVINASRFALELKLGRRLRGLTVCHTCDTPSCCNPSHLYAGSASDNQRDRWLRTGRLRSNLVGQEGIEPPTNAV